MNMHLRAASVLGIGLWAASPPASAEESLEWSAEHRVTLGAAWRAESRDPANIGIANGGEAYSTNGDDGNLAFDSGDVVATAAKLTSNLTVSRGDFGLFVRGSYLFDATLNGFDPFDRNSYYVPTPGLPDPGVGLTPTGRPSEAPLAEYLARTRKINDYLGNDADLIDAYLFGELGSGLHALSFKLGRQTINWGESTFVLHGINSLVSFDQNQLRVPGAALDEITRPAAYAWFSTSFTETVTAEAFYQLEWRQTQIDAPGSFYSTNDFVGPGGGRAHLGFGLAPENTPNTTIPRAATREPGDDGQFGAKLGWATPYLNQMELALYAMNFHSRLPVVSGTSKASFAAPSVTGSYFIEYPEDIQLYGVSFNTTVGDWSLQGEYSYKADQPLQIDDVELLLAGVGLPSQLTPPPSAPLGAALGNQTLRGWRRHDVSQLDFGLTGLYGPLPALRWDRLLLVGEVGAVYVHDLPPESRLRYDGPATYAPGDAAVAALVSASTLPAFGRAVPVQPGGYASPFSWGYKLIARATYNNVFGRFRLEPTLRFDHDVVGITPFPIANFIADRKQLSAHLDVSYWQSWTVRTGYTALFGGGQQNLLSDRDYVDLSVEFVF